MSTFGRRLTDDGIARVLDHWLDDGPIVAPDLMVESALRTAARIPQRRWRGRLLRFAGASPLVPVGLTLAAVAAVMALGAGLGQVLPLPGTAATPTPGVTGTPAPDASDPSSGGVIYTNEEAGYALTLPARWTPSEFFTDPPGTMRFGGAHDDSGGSYFGALTVSIGSTDGTVYDCAPSLCRPVVATTIDELDAAIASDSVPTATPMITTTDVDLTLDGEPARLEYVTFTGGLIEAGPQFHHVFAIHNGRPIVLSFDKYAYGLGRESNDIGWVETLIQGFQFLATDAEPSPLPGIGLYRDQELGFEIAVREDWELRQLTSHGKPAPGVVGFGEAMDHTYPAMTVSIGDASGSVLVCTEGLYCTEVQATSLSELVEAVSGGTPGPQGPPGVEEVTMDIALDGEAAVYEGFDYPGFFWTARPMVNRVLAFHDGKPVVVSFDHYTFSTPLSFNEQTLIHSFRFLDDPAPGPSAEPDPSPASLRTHVFAEAGFAVDVPATWRTARAGEPTIARVIGPEGGIRLRMSNENEEILTCLGLARCQPVSARTAEDLLSVVKGEYRVEWGITMSPTVRTEPITLDGAAATRVTVSPPRGMTGPGTTRCVLLIRDGQAFIVEWTLTMSGPGLWDEILASFRFTD